MANYVTVLPSPMLASILQMGVDLHKTQYGNVVHITPEVQRFLRYIVQMTEGQDSEVKEMYLTKIEGSNYNPRKIYRNAI